MTELSFGQQRVRVSFNPSKDSGVDHLKAATADLIDLCYTGQNEAKSQETKRLWSLAMTHYEEAAMWAVKAATTPKID